LKKIPSEGGSGGKRGHSGIEHSDYTEAVKDAARRVRRHADRSEVEVQLRDDRPEPQTPDCSARS